MNNVEITEEFSAMDIFQSFDLTAARFNHTQDILELGCNMEKVNRYLKEKTALPFFNQFENMAEYYEKYSGPLVVHESIHRILYHQDRGANQCLDDVDNNHEISGFGVEEERR